MAVYDCTNPDYCGTADADTLCDNCAARVSKAMRMPAPAVVASLPVQRYDLVTNYRAGTSIEEMERSDEGDWLHWEDALAMTDSVRLEHAEWDKRRIAELQDLRRRHVELQAALLVLKGELEQLMALWRASANDANKDGDFCCALTREHDAEDLELKVAKVGQLLER